MGQQERRRNGETERPRGAETSPERQLGGVLPFFFGMLTHLCVCEHVFISGVAMARRVAAGSRPRGDLAFDEPHAAASISLSLSLSLSVRFISLARCFSVTTIPRHTHTHTHTNTHTPSRLERCWHPCTRLQKKLNKHTRPNSFFLPFILLLTDKLVFVSPTPHRRTSSCRHVVTGT